MPLLTLSHTTILDSSKLKEIADDNFKFDKNGGKGLQTGRKHCGKRRNCSLRAISPFPAVFSKDLHCRQVKTRACLGKDQQYFSHITATAHIIHVFSGFHQYLAGALKCLAQGHSHEKPRGSNAA